MHVKDKETAARQSFEIQRTFPAPLARVWKAWSDPQQLTKWWGPKGCAIEVLSLDFRAGGFFHYAMNFAGAPPTWGRFNYREIVPKRRLRWLNSFANAQCGIARAPFSELCPLEIENDVSFATEAGQTTVTLHADPFGATPEEVEYFVGLCSSGSLTQGYGGSFDKLVDLLRSMTDRI